MSSIGLAHGDASSAGRACGSSSPATSCCPPARQPHGFQITDANGPMLAALAERDGAIVDFPGLVRDDARCDSLDGVSHADADVVIVSGGSSVGIEDLAPMLVAEAWRAGRPRHRDATEQPDRAWDASARAWSSCSRAIPCRRSAPTTSSPAARFARSAAARRSGRIARCAARSPARSARRSAASTTRACGSIDGAASNRSAGRRRVGAVVHDARRRLRDRRRGQRRLRRGRRRRGLALCVSRSSSSRSSIATKRNAASAPRSIWLRAAIEPVALDAALGRVLAADVVSPVDVPSFDRSNVDGFAVVAEDTFGASEEVPRRVRLADEVIHTGVVPTDDDSIAARRWRSPPAA